MCAPSSKRLVDSTTTGPVDNPPPSSAGDGESNSAPMPTDYHPGSYTLAAVTQDDPGSAHRLLEMPDYQNNNLHQKVCIDSDLHPMTRTRKLLNAKNKVLSFLRQKCGVILTGAVCILFFNIIGWMGCYSVLFVSLQDEFHSSATETGWVGSLAFIITSLVTPFKDCLRRRFSNRSICIIGVICCSVSVVTSSLVPQLFYLFFTFGVLYGVGTGLVFKSSLDLLLSRFPSYCGRVSFLILTGSTAGVFAWTPILTALIDLWGWRQTCRISAAVILLVCLPSTLPMGMAPPPPQFDDTKKSPDTKNAHDAEIADGKLKSDRKKARQTRNNKEEIKWAGLKEKRILFMPEAWLFGLANLVSYVSMGFYNVNLVSYATSLGYSSNQGSTLLTIAAASEAGCKLVFAIFVDKLPFRKAHLMAVLSLASTLITLSCAFVPSFSVLCVIGVGMGLLRAAMNALPFPVGMEIFGPRKTSGSNTLILFAGGLGTITSAFAIGGTYDAFNSYDVAIYICTGCLLLTTVLYVLIPLISRLHKVIGLRVRIDEVTGVAEVIPVVEDETVMIEEFVTVL